MKTFLKKCLIWSVVTTMILPAWLVMNFMNAATAKASVPVTTLVDWTFPNDPDNATADGGIAANLSKTISVVTADSIDFHSDGATTNAAKAKNWSGTGDRYWLVSFTTTGYSSITLSSKQRGSEHAPRNFKIQTSLNNSTWSDVAGGNIVNDHADSWTDSSANLTNLSLGSGVDNQSLVYVRWLRSSTDGVEDNPINGGSYSYIDDIYVYGVQAADTTAPVISGVTEGQITNGNLTPTITDPDDSFTALLNGNPYTSGTTISTAASYTLVATDTHGNSTTRHFTIDKTGPVISGIAGFTGTTGDPTTVSANVTDSLSGLASVQISVDGGGYVAMTAGTAPAYSYGVVVPSSSLASITYQIKATDNATNVTTSAVQTITVTDNDAPVISSITSSPDTTGDTTTITVVATDNIGIVSAEININGAGWVPMIGSGPYTYPYTISNHDVTDIPVSVRLKDAAGNTGTANRTIHPNDDEAPVITVLPSNPVTIERGSTYTDAGATALDNVDGNITSQIVVTNPVDTSVLGDYTVQYNVSDTNGNEAIEQTRLVHVVDTIAPAVTFSDANPVNALITNVSNHTFSVDTDEPVSWCKLNFGNGNFENGLTNWTTGGYVSLVNDTYHSANTSLLLQTTNDHGGSNDYAYTTVTLPSSGPINLSAWIRQSTTDGIFWDQQQIFLTDTNGSMITSLMYTLGNVGWHNVNFDISAYAGQTVRVYFWVHDDGAGDPSRMWVDDVSINGVLGGNDSIDMTIAGNHASVDLTDMIDGTYNYNVTCADSNGNIGTSESRTLTIDTVAPIISNVSDGGTYYNVSVTPTWNEGSATLAKDSGPANPFTSSEISEAGEYVLTATDEASNSSHVSFTLVSGEVPADPIFVLPDNSHGDLIISVASNVTNPRLDLSNFLLEGSSITLSQDLSIEILSLSGKLDIVIPAGTTITGPEGWDGILNLPRLVNVDPTTLTVTATKAPDSILGFEVGLGSAGVTFEGPIKMTFVGQAGERVGFFNGIIFNEIVQVLDDANNPTNIPATGAGKIDANTDLVVWTYHFTTFASYGEKEVAAPDFTATGAVVGSAKVITVNWTGTGADSYIVSINGIPQTFTADASDTGKSYSKQITVADWGTYTVLVKAVIAGVSSLNTTTKSVTFTAPAITPVVLVSAAVAATTTSGTTGGTTGGAVSTSSTPVTVPTTAATQDTGIIKAAETKTDDGKVNWTPWIILFGLILLAGLATGGYFYWFAGKDDDDEDDDKKKKAEKDLAKIKNGGVTVRSKSNSGKTKRW